MACLLIPAQTIHAQQPGDLVYVVATNARGVSFIPTSIEQPGMLGEAQLFETVNGSTSDVAVGDFNGDGHPDFATCKKGRGIVDVFLRQKPLLPYQFSHTNFAVGDGFGTFHAIEAADFNNDGFDDLVLADTTGGASVYRSDPANPGVTFTSFGEQYSAGNYAHHVVVADFNQDGNSDFAVANTGSGGIPLFIFYGVGDGTFQKEEVPFEMPGYNPDYVILGDFNVDGLPDLAVDSSSKNRVGNSHVIVFLNVNGNFLPNNTLSIDLAMTDSILTLTAGDFIADTLHLPDLAVGFSNLTQTVGTSLVIVQTNYAPQPGDDQTRDFSIYSNKNWETLLAGVNDIPGGMVPTDFSSADVDKDGYIDLIASYGAGDSSGVFVLNGNGKGDLSFLSHASMHVGRSNGWHRLMFEDSNLVTSFPFNRGDVNADGAINLTDAVYLLQALFSGKPQPTCQDAADANDDGEINLTDAVFILNYLFQGGPQPPTPFQQCGADLTPDDLTCVAFPADNCP